MNPPYSEDDHLCIKSFVQNEADPPTENWSTFECLLKRSGRTYAELMNVNPSSNDYNMVKDIPDEEKGVNELFEVPGLTERDETNKELSESTLDTSMVSIESTSNATGNQIQTLTVLNETSLIDKIQEILTSNAKEITSQIKKLLYFLG